VSAYYPRRRPEPGKMKVFLNYRLRGSPSRNRLRRPDVHLPTSYSFGFRGRRLSGRIRRPKRATASQHSPSGALLVPTCAAAVVADVRYGDYNQMEILCTISKARLPGLDLRQYFLDGFRLIPHSLRTPNL
jgi:hypothetical protein